MVKIKSASIRVLAVSLVLGLAEAERRQAGHALRS
jgi:hypothetical protein